MKIKMRLIKNEKTNKQTHIENRVTNLPFAMFHFVLAKKFQRIKRKKRKPFSFSIVERKNSNVSKMF